MRGGRRWGKSAAEMQMGNEKGRKEVGACRGESDELLRFS